MKILHIAAHIGGGIGSAFTGLTALGQEQKILLLEEPVNKLIVEQVRQVGFEILYHTSNSQVIQEITQADIVVFSWSHHPALTKFLYELPQVPFRSVLWCHVSGNYFPYISPLFLRHFQHVLFATPYSLALPQVKGMGEDYVKEHFSVVYGQNNLEYYSEINAVPHKGFNIGYVGTLGFCKLHPNFIQYCAAIDIPDVQFIMVGSPTTKAELLQEAQQYGIEDQIIFCGQVSDVIPLLARMDMFGYLLNPQHFGATENALLEAMAAGLPVVALNQNVERYIIQDKKTGWLINSPHEYAKVVRQIYENHEYAKCIGQSARIYMKEHYHIEKNRKNFLSSCRKVSSFPKQVHDFKL